MKRYTGRDTLSGVEAYRECNAMGGNCGQCSRCRAEAKLDEMIRRKTPSQPMPAVRP